MSKETHIELANRALDGDLTEQEISDFEAALKTDPTLREIQKSIQSVDILMRDATSVEPPPQLRQNVMRAVKEHHAANSAQPGWLTGVISRVKRKMEIQPSMGIGFGFAMGVLLLAGVSTMTDIPWNSVGGPEAVGTIGNQKIIDNAAITNAIDISVEGKFSGLVEFEWTDRSVSIDVSIESPEALTVALEFESTDLEIISIENLSESITDINYDMGSILISHDGSTSFSLVFERQSAKTSDLTLIVSQAGEILNETVIELR